MVEILTYHSVNAPAHKAWLAYPVLDGLWLVRCEAATEIEAIERAKAWYEAEKARQQRIVGKSEDEQPVARDSERSNPGRGAGFMGSVWLLNRATGHRLRAAAGEAARLIEQGYVRAGPRSA